MSAVMQLRNTQRFTALLHAGLLSAVFLQGQRCGQALAASPPPAPRRLLLPSRPSASPVLQPSPAPPPSVPPPSSSKAALLLAAAPLFPGTLCDLTFFKLQLPVGTPNVTGEVTVLQPLLRTFTHPAFYLRAANSTAPATAAAAAAVDPSSTTAAATTAGRAIAFVVAAGGVTTAGSEFPRSELAESVYSGRGGVTAASWNISGPRVHTMTFTGATLRLTPVRPNVVIAQIKGKVETPLQIRVQGSAGGKYNLWVCLYNHTVIRLAYNYVLGTPYTIKISAGQGRIQVYYQDLSTPAVTVENTAETTAAGVYFKVGNYLQSNVAKGESATATSEVWLHALQLA